MTFNYEGQKNSLKEIYKMNCKRRGRSKYLLSVVVGVEKDGTDIPAKVVYVRNRSNQKDYLCLISTNINIDEEEIIRIYSKRWQIEAFSNIMIEEFDLDEEKISSVIDKFVSALTPSMQRHLQAA